MLELILIASLATLAVFAIGVLCCLWYLRRRNPAESRRLGKRCDICLEGLPVNAIRTHDGHWRCAAHKGA